MNAWSHTCLHAILWMRHILAHLLPFLPNSLTSRQVSESHFWTVCKVNRNYFLCHLSCQFTENKLLVSGGFMHSQVSLLHFREKSQTQTDGIQWQFNFHCQSPSTISHQQLRQHTDGQHRSTASIWRVQLCWNAWSNVNWTRVGEDLNFVQCLVLNVAIKYKN